MIPAPRKRMAVAAGIGVMAFVAAVAVANVANPRDPGLGMMLPPWLGMAGVVALLVALWSYVKAKGRSGWWMLVLVLNVVGLAILAFLPDRGLDGAAAPEKRGAFRRFLSYVLASSGALMVSLFAVLSVYAGWMWWEGRQLRSLCAEANEGVAVSALPALAEKYGFGRHWVERGIRDGNGPGRVAYVPASSTMGEVACAIHYNDTRVVSAKVR